MSSLPSSITGTVLLIEALPDDPLAQVFVGLLVLTLVTIVGRFLLSLAWKILLIAMVAVGGLYVLSLAGL